MPFLGADGVFSWGIRMGVGYGVEAFINECHSICQEFVSPADIVQEVCPALEKLTRDPSFLKPEHFAPNPDHYARHPVFLCEKGTLSLFTMVWDPGQWTPVHDHGTWGVVAVVQGVLEERNFIRVDNRQRDDSGIVLSRGGLSLLGVGSVTTFVPNPDHIHRTGVSRSRSRAVSLHLYGRTMTNYNVYDLELGRRQRIEVGCELGAMTTA
jgi:predicted metal-dependent enzyme (double-stranded beta helix superfamily)